MATIEFLFYANPSDFVSRFHLHLDMSAPVIQILCALDLSASIFDRDSSRSDHRGFFISCVEC